MKSVFITLIMHITTLSLFAMDNDEIGKKRHFKQFCFDEMSQKKYKIDFTKPIKLVEDKIPAFFDQFYLYCLDNKEIILKIDQKDINDITLDLVLPVILTYGKNIKHLSLNNCFLNDNSIKAIGECEMLNNLTVLRLINISLNDEGVKEIFNSVTLKKLAVLNLEQNNITDEGAEIISSSNNLKELIKLILIDNKITQDGLEKLHFTKLPKLKEISYTKEEDNSIKPSIFKKAENIDNILLPAEIWCKIIEVLSMNDRQSLKHTSRYFCNLLTGELCKKITIKYNNIHINCGHIYIDSTNNKMIMVNVRLSVLNNAINDGLKDNTITNMKHLKFIDFDQYGHDIVNIKKTKDFDLISSKIFNHLISIDLREIRLPKPHAIAILKKILKNNSRIIIKFELKSNADNSFIEKLKELSRIYKDAVFVYRGEIFSYENKMPKWL